MCVAFSCSVCVDDDSPHTSFPRGKLGIDPFQLIVTELYSGMLEVSSLLGLWNLPVDEERTKCLTSYNPTVVQGTLKVFKWKKVHVWICTRSKTLADRAVDSFCKAS